MRTFLKIWSIFEAVFFSSIHLLMLGAAFMIFKYCYKIIKTCSIPEAILCIAYALFILVICIVIIDNGIRYLKAQFKKCENCGNKIHQNTSLGGQHIRFTCIDCGEDKWETDL